jgi:hypothetical protein
MLSIGGVLILVLAVSYAVSIGIDTTRQIRSRTELRGSSNVVRGWKEQLSPGGRGRDEKLKYSFSVVGQNYTGETRVPIGHLNAVAYSDGLQIRYLPADPNVNHPADWEWTPEWGQIVFIPLMFGMGLFLLAAVLIERQVVANGIPVNASITACSANGKGGYRVTYEFRAEDGTEMQGTGWSASDQEVGSRICVLYLPQNPKRNQPYPGQLVEVAE